MCPAFFLLATMIILSVLLSLVLNIDPILRKQHGSNSDGDKWS
jgi:hypothetical protein